MTDTQINHTHWLKCRHCVGKNCRTYYMPCNILKTMADGRLKIEVFGDRGWKDTLNIRKIRYVKPSKLIEKSV